MSYRHWARIKSTDADINAALAWLDEAARRRSDWQPYAKAGYAFNMDKFIRNQLWRRAVPGQPNEENETTTIAINDVIQLIGSEDAPIGE